ncbi:MAG: hypothetical protein J0H02_14635 [Armatimonadetes bacterium]|nr:hypothetical protein [Armatimonadota bacterium]
MSTIIKALRMASSSLLMTAIVSSAMATYTNKPVSILLKSNGEVVVVSHLQSNGTDAISDKASVMWFSSTGVLTYSRDYNYVIPMAAGLDSQDAVYFAGSYQGNQFFVARRLGSGSSGAWEKTWSGNGGTATISDLAVGTQQSVLVCGYAWDGTKYDSYARRYPLSGLSPTIATDSTSYSSKWTDVACDTSHRIVVAGTEKDSSGVSKAVAYKFDSSGSVTSSLQQGADVHEVELFIDSSNRYYLSYNYTYDDGGVDREAVCAQKLGTGGFSSAWSTTFDTVFSPPESLQMALDPSGNVAICTTVPGSWQSTLTRLDTSGTVEWQTTTAYEVFAMGFNSAGSLYTVWDAPSSFDSVWDSTGTVTDVGVTTGDSYRKLKNVYISASASGTAYSGVYVISEITGGANQGKFLIETPSWNVIQ